jgi:tetratricopeptide (TPR) repeat protein
MSLFMRILGNPDQPQRSPSLYPATAHPAPGVDIHEAPHIIRYLGEQLGMHAAQRPLSEIDVADIQNIEEYTSALQHMLDKTSRIYQKWHAGELEHTQIANLVRSQDSEIHKLESRLMQLNVESKLDATEIQRLQQVTSQLRAIVGSFGNWANFLSTYFACDERCEQALASVSSIVFSNLHGCSPAAIQGLQEALRALHELIDLSAAQLAKPGHPFASMLWNELSDSIQCTTSTVEDWCHEVSSRSSRVFQQSLELWDKAESFEAKQEAAALLLSQQQLVHELETSLKLESSIVKLENLTCRSLQQLPAQTETQYLQIQGQLGALSEAIASLKTEIPSKRSFVDAEIHRRNISGEINKALATADVEAIENRVAQIAVAYAPVAGEATEKAIERYVDMKRALLPFVGISKTAKTFCQQEEVRLTTLAGYASDFEGMAHALLLKEVKLPTGFFGSIIDPENWSDSTKSWVHTILITAQLSAEALNFYQQLPLWQLPEVTLSIQDRNAIEKELSLLKILITTNKYELLGDQGIFDRLTRKVPKIREALQELVKYSKAPSRELQNQFFAKYEAYRQDVILRKITPSPSQWVSQLENLSTPAYQAAVLQKDAQPRLGQITDAAEIAFEAIATSAMAAKSGTEQLKLAEQAMQASQTLIRQCSFAEYIQPKTATTSTSLHALKQEVAHMQHSLRATMLSQPQSPVGPEWATWNTAVAEQCFAVRNLEKCVNHAMAHYEEAMAIGSFQQEAEAALKGFGNKHLNLIRMNSLNKALEMSGIEIPVPQGIESYQVHRFLQATAPIVFSQWEALGKLYTAYRGEEPFLKTAAAVEHMKVIAATIQKAFAAAGRDEQAFRALGLGEEVQQWLDQMAAEGHYLMMRSSGAEDTKESANAGGNISVAYVKPTHTEFCEALGQVVSSYFGAVSLQNRLNLKTNPFTEQLELAVTAQKLIGEPIGGAESMKDVPISVVLFTNEPLYFGDEEFRAMRLSAAFGHGEGVVGNQGLGTDTVLILQSVAHPDKIFYTYDNQPKPERLTPILNKETGKVSLQKVANSPEFAEAPVLTPELILRLYEWGVVGEKFFRDSPTDMEIVIKNVDGNDWIYPVQARPIVRPKLLPTYLDLKKLGQASNSPVISAQKLRAIVPGRALVVKLECPEEMETADILENAERKFNKEVHKLVVVGQSEPSNSHPVVNFSSMGIPCLWTHNLAAVQEMAKQITGTHSIAVCMQSGQMLLWDTSKGPISDYISQGFVVHPANIAHSLPVKAPMPVDSRVAQILPEEIHDALFRLQTAVSREAALQELQALCASTPLQAFRAKISALEKIAAEGPLQAKIVTSTLAVAKGVEVRLAHSFEEIEALLIKPNPSGRMELLLHVKILATLLFQTQITATGIAQHSVATLTSTFAAIDALVGYQRKLDKPAQFIDLLMDGTKSPVDGFFDEWQSFLLALEEATPLAEESLVTQAYEHFLSWASGAPSQWLLANEIMRFKDVLQIMRRTGTLPLFAAFFFAGLKKDSPVETLRAINALIPQEEEPRIQQLLSHSERIAQMRREISLFGDPKASFDSWERLQTAIAPFLQPQNGWMEKSQWDALSPIARSIATQIMNELVDVYDLSIKAMKASSEIAEIDKIQEFKKLLGPYLHLLRSWAEGTVDSKEFAMHSEWPLNVCLDIIEMILTKFDDSDLNQLQGSKEFSVSASALGSGTSFDRHRPKTLEDVFTYIHQSLLTTTAILLKQTLAANQLQSSNIPENLQFLLDHVKVIGGAKHGIYDYSVGNPVLIGVEVTSQHLAFHYNIPMRSHSGKIIMQYDHLLNKTTMKAQFLGLAGERWDDALERAMLLHGAGVLLLAEHPKMTAQELFISWDISTQESAREALKEYRLIAKMSLDISHAGFSKEQVADFIFELSAHGQLREGVLQLLTNTPPKGIGKAAISALAEEVFADASDPLLRNVEFLRTLVSIGDKFGESILSLFAAKVSGPVEQEEWLGNIANEYTLTAQHLLQFELDFMLDLAAAGLKSIDAPTQKAALNLFESAISNNLGIEKTILEALKFFSDLSTYQIALQLFKALFAQGKGFDEALRAAQKAISDPDSSVRYIALQLFKALFVQGKGFDEALRASQKAISDPDGNGYIGLELLKVLVAQGKCFDEALRAAQRAISDPYGNVRYSDGLSLLEALVAQGKCFDEATLAAQTAINDPSWSVRYSGLVLLKALVAQGKCFDEATLAAQTAISDPDFSVRYIGRRLLEALVAQGKSSDEAI